MAVTRALEGQVAVVAGATRGAGRGIARGLGEAGATVYCTGRSVRGEPSPYGRPETIEETAELVTAAGGTGIAVRVDHTVDADVKELMARISRDHGRLDVLVSSIAGEDPRFGGWTPLWKTDLSRGASVLEHALLSHLITARHAIPLMLPHRRGLIVEVTEGDLALGGGNALSDVVKSALKGFACRLSEELRPHGVTAVSVTPGFLRSESMLDHFGVSAANWKKACAVDPNFLASETPLFLGRAVAALAADPDMAARSGDVLSSWELSRVYGVTDEDGSRPDWGTHWTTILPTLGGLRDAQRRHAEWLERLSTRARQYVGPA